MLAPVFVSLGEAVSGRPAAELMAALTGLSPQRLRKRLALPIRPLRRAIAEQNIERGFANALVEAGVDTVEAQKLAECRPQGVLEGTMYQLGYFSEELHSTGLTELRELDEVDVRIGHFIDKRDLKGLWLWLRTEEGLPSRLSHPVNAAGVPRWPEVSDEVSLERVQATLGNVLVHQLLSFLAVLDHEIKPVVATSHWDGYSLVATLIAPPAQRGGRLRVLSPIALLIDLVAASAMATTDGRWPDRRPIPSQVSEWMASRGLGGTALDHRLHRLRSEHATLSGNVFKAFVREIRRRPAALDQVLEEEARMVFPLLVAAHLLTLLMPRLTKSIHHDRRGWREAYLDWWRHHAMARGVPHEPAGAAGPPSWINFD